MRYISSIWLVLSATFIIWNIGRHFEFYTTTIDYRLVWVFPFFFVAYLICASIFLSKLPKGMWQKHTVEKFLYDYKCTMLPEEENQKTFNYLGNLSRQYGVINPRIF